MAHFAQINENNVVVNVLVVPDEQEHREQAFLADDLGLGGTWVQTSYNNNIRNRYAMIGGTYDPGNDVFIDIKPFDSWSLDSDYNWQPPTPYPDDGNLYFWSEDEQQWNLYTR
jgi:hypothetical protein